MPGGDEIDFDMTFVSAEADSTPRTNEGSDRLSLLVISDQLITTLSLPESGKLKIGRARTCEIMINDSSISRHHATLEIGPTLTLRDENSANGTRVRNQPLEGGAVVTIECGEVLQLGKVTLIVQQRPVAKMHRVWHHEYFEARLDEECARAQREASTFAVARFHCDPPVS